MSADRVIHTAQNARGDGGNEQAKIRGHNGLRVAVNLAKISPPGGAGKELSREGGWPSYTGAHR